MPVRRELLQGPDDVLLVHLEKKDEEAIRSKNERAEQCDLVVSASRHQHQHQQHASLRPSLDGYCVGLIRGSLTSTATHGTTGLIKEISGPRLERKPHYPASCFCLYRSSSYRQLPPQDTPDDNDRAERTAQNRTLTGGRHSGCRALTCTSLCASIFFRSSPTPVLFPLRGPVSRDLISKLRASTASLRQHKKDTPTEQDVQNKPSHHPPKHGFSTLCV